MTDRIKALVVTFERDNREDDIQPIIDTLQMITGVASVVPLKAALGDLVIHQRIKSELSRKIWEALDD